MLSKIKVMIANLGPTKFFLIAGAVSGLSFLIITPPFQGADETVHFMRAYQISEGNLVIDQVGNKVGGYLPSSIGETYTVTNSPPIAFYPQLKYHEIETRRAFHIKLKSSQKTLYDFGSTTEYSPVAYLPSSIGILFGRLAHAPPILSFYLGRLGNLAAWLGLAGLAIMYMPRKKWALAAVSLLPMVIFQAATINGDVVTIGTMFLFFALILNLREKKSNVSHKELIYLLITGLAMALTKEIMFIFLPAILLIGKNKFETSRQAWLTKIILMGIPFLALLGWYWTIHGINLGASAYGNGAVPAHQLKYIIRSPLRYINVLWNTYFYTWGNNVTDSFIGNFGWDSAPLSDGLIVIGFITLAFLLGTSTRKEKPKWLNRNEKWIIAAIGILYWLAVSTSLYIDYSPVTFRIIVGLQGRYFFPLALLFIPLLYNKAIITSEKLYKQVAIFLPSLMLVASVFTVYIRFFIHNV
jgi:uncharacterized membrane protein